MRTRWSILVAIALWLAIDIPGAAAAPNPEAEYDELKKLQANAPPPGMERNSAAYIAWQQDRLRTLHDRGREFISRYSTHPRRWDVLVLLQLGPNYYIRLSPDGAPAVDLRLRERAEWATMYFPMLEELLESVDASPAARQQALLQLIDYHNAAIRRGAVDHPKAKLVPALLSWVNQLHALDPRSGRLAALYVSVAHMLNAIDPALCRAFLEEKRSLHASNVQADSLVRNFVQSFLRLMKNQEGLADELWADLQRMDPGLTDLSPYRGKVVLLAGFPAEWADRVRQLETIHANYHERGLEIIHITTIYPQFLASPLASGSAPLADGQRPWRAVRDDARPPNQFMQLWAQNSIPGFLVIGRDGRIARELPGDLNPDTLIARELHRQAEGESLDRPALIPDAKLFPR